MKLKTIVILIAVAVELSCSKRTPAPSPSPQAELYEEVKTSFSLPDLDESFSFQGSICQNPDPLTLSLSYVGESGFFYTCGLAYYRQEGEISDFIVQFYARGFDGHSSSRLDIPMLYELCTSHPEQCFVNLSLSFRNERYTAVNYSVTPYRMAIRDSNAGYSYNYTDSEHVLECFENRRVLPVKFEFEGCIYTNDYSDSLKVSDFNSSFLLFESY